MTDVSDMTDQGRKKKVHFFSGFNLLIRIDLKEVLKSVNVYIQGINAYAEAAQIGGILEA